MTQNTKSNNKGGLWAAFFLSLKNIVKSLLTQEVIVKYLQEKLIKFIIKKMAITAGWQVWLVKLITEELVEEIAVPVINIKMAEIGMVYDKKEGKAAVTKISLAEDNEDEDDYDSGLNDLYN
jgi:cellobiose-specific phosphotransferase system component IIB